MRLIEGPALPSAPAPIAAIDLLLNYIRARGAEFIYVATLANSPTPSRQELDACPGYIFISKSGERQYLFSNETIETILGKAEASARKHELAAQGVIYTAKNRGIDRFLVKRRIGRTPDGKPARCDVIAVRASFIDPHLRPADESGNGAGQADSV